jgi:hypothetical protein
MANPHSKSSTNDKLTLSSTKYLQQDVIIHTQICVSKQAPTTIAELKS